MFHYLSNTGAQETAALLAERDGVKISRQSVNKYFLNLGYHLFLNFYYPDALLILLGERLERDGWPHGAIRARGLHIAYRCEFADELFKMLDLGPDENAALHERLLQIPAALKRYIEEDAAPGNDVIETVSDGAVLTRLRDNHFLVSAIRAMRRRAYGYAREHYLAYFGKAYFMEVFMFAGDGARTDSEALDSRWSSFGMRIWLGTYLGTHPMTLQDPAACARQIQERLGAQRDSDAR